MSEQPVKTTTTEKPPADRTARWAAIRAGIATALLIGGIVAVRGLEAAMHATFDKPPAALQKELSEMKRELGRPVRYVASRPDQVLDHATEETLGTTKYLVREYTDQSLPVGSRGRLVNLNLNYYDTGSSTPHVPETCWKGAGREEADVSRVMFDVKGIERKNGSKFDVRMRMVSFLPLPNQPIKNDRGEAIYSNVAYVFQVNGDYVSSPTEVMSHFWKASYKYAYHSKIEVTPLETVIAPDGSSVAMVLNCTQEEAKKIVSDFIREALPAVEECLPDPAILTEDDLKK